MDPLRFTLLITHNDWTPLFISEGFLAFVESIEREPTDSPPSIVTIEHRIDFPISPTSTGPACYITEITEIFEMVSFRNDITSLQVKFDTGQACTLPFVLLVKPMSRPEGLTF
jgi:hypothetical protein